MSPFLNLERLHRHYQPSVKQYDEVPASNKSWDWPNVPDVKQLHALGQAAYRTEQGNVTISPDGKLIATGRKVWDFPTEGEEPEMLD